MNYIGSKLSLLDFLEESITSIVDKDCRIFCDLFAGTGAVGSHFKKKGYSIISNDIQYYSYVLNRHYIGNHKELKFSKLLSTLPALKSTAIKLRKNEVCRYLSNIKGNKGFIYQNYSIGGGKSKEFERMYYSDENAKKCDAIRKKIEEWKLEDKINDDEYYFLLTSLLESIDKYSNTASVYGAFLKTMKKSALRTFKLSHANLILNDQEHEIYNEESNNLITKINPDILYLDPPYNQRQYGSNYHLLETIAKYDYPEIHGKTGLRNYDNQKSDYCSKPKVKKAFKNLILNSKSKYIFLSYNNEGLMSLKDIKEVMSLKGKYGFFTKEYSRYKADNNRNYLTNKTTEYIHYVECNL
ncbi:MAG: DNA adenine methylase [Alphaproteobacteria bacterium]|nr:DNA adenine methylase [Alphaproteobacteria bacterium]MBL0717778.1 DNA adenine methylase [Alphaproteobacteria bacterium]